MLSELFWILAGIAYTGKEICKEYSEPKNQREFLAKIGANPERQHNLEFNYAHGYDIRKKEEFDRLVGYEWRNQFYGFKKFGYDSSYLVREIAKREGWTYVGYEIRQSPGYMKASGCKKSDILIREKKWNELKPYPERQKKWLDMAQSLDENVRYEVCKKIQRLYNPYDPISVEIAIRQIGWGEWWAYDESPSLKPTGIKK